MTSFAKGTKVVSHAAIEPQNHLPRTSQIPRDSVKRSGDVRISINLRFLKWHCDHESHVPQILDRELFLRQTVKEIVRVFNQAPNTIGQLLNRRETSCLHNPDYARARPNPLAELVINQLFGVAI